MAQCGKYVDVSDWAFGTREPVCIYNAGHDEEHPCSVRQERVGEPCRYCGTQLAQLPCPDCWTPVPDNLADQKALFARVGLSVG